MFDASRKSEFGWRHALWVARPQFASAAGHRPRHGRRSFPFSHASHARVRSFAAMAPATAGVLAGISPEHLPGLAGGVAAVVLGALVRRRRLDVLTALILCTAGAHLGLALGHASTLPALSVLFVLDGFAYLALLALPRGRWWRWAAAALLLSTIVAYLVYVGSGREAPEPVGVADKLVEIVALGLVLQPAGGRRGRWRAASFATLFFAFATGAVLWIEDMAFAAHQH